MSDDQEPLSPEQVLLRCRAIDSEREDVLRQQAALGEHYRAAQQEKQELLAEMTRLGTSPQTIRADLTRLNRDLQSKSQEYQSQVRSSGEKLADARRALAELQTPKKKV